ncbi:MAG: pantothenate kinase, partial [Candidatus Omnitrophica bacterium CG_4_9_14_0_2_um_filter_42_8]
MLLAIDIGNTSIHSGIFDKKVLKKTFRIPAYSKNLDSLYAGKLKTCVK